MERAWKLGRLAFTTRGNHPIADLLREEFDSLPTTGEPPQLAIEVRDQLPDPGGQKIYLSESLYSQGKALHGNEKRAGYTFALQNFNQQNGPLHAVISCHPGTVPTSVLQALGQWLDKRRDWNFLSPAERAAKHILYDLINPLLHLSMLNLEQGFCHAGAIVNPANHAVVLMGSPGTGKTSLVLALLEEGDWRYLSDDLLVVDAKGQAHTYPMKMQIYGYNILGNVKLLERVLRDRSLDDFLHWRLRLSMRGPHKVRRRISARDLFNQEKIGNEGRLSRVFFLIRAQTRTLQIEDISPQELARRSAHIIVYEYRKFLEKVNLWALESADLDTKEIFQKSRSLYEKSFSQVHCHKVYIPLSFTPSQLYESLHPYLPG